MSPAQRMLDLEDVFQMTAIGLLSNKSIILTGCIYFETPCVYNMSKEDLAGNNLQWLICHKT